MNNHSAALALLFCMLAGCAASPPRSDGPNHHHRQTAPAEAVVPTTRDGTSTATTVEEYKRVLADRIAATNSVHMYVGRPQALLRSVIVVKVQIDAAGKLVRSEIMRSNRDRANEATALSSLKAAAPFPKPSVHLLRHGNVEIMESWLFNNDGRFQIRTTAQRQMDH